MTIGISDSVLLRWKRRLSGVSNMGEDERDFPGSSNVLGVLAVRYRRLAEHDAPD